MTCNIVTLGENLLCGWCRMRVRPFATDVKSLFVQYLVVNL